MRSGHTWGLVLAALLLLTAPVAAEDLDWESADGSFPDHGGCTHLAPPGGISPHRTAADDYAAMRQRTKDTYSVLAMIPRPRRAALSDSVADTERKTPPAVECSGIDSCIEQVADTARVPLASLTTDVEFLRRVTLDLTGRIPDPDDILVFQFSMDPTKRTQAVQELLDKPEWADRWAKFFGDLYRNTRVTAAGDRFHHTRDSFHMFLLESLQQNKPYDQMAREILAAEGPSDGRTYPELYTDYEHYASTHGDWKGNPAKASAVGYIVGGRTFGGPIQDTYDTLAHLTARDFLGISTMDCILCHDGAHRLEGLSAWGTDAKRYDGWRLAAFFSSIPRLRSWHVPPDTLPPRGGKPENKRVKPEYVTVYDLPPGQTDESRRGDLAGKYLAHTAGGNRPDRRNADRFVAPGYPFNQSATPVDETLRFRVQLGQHLTQDPQFARAIVNYIWREFFSRGIVEPADQFDLNRLDPANPPEGDMGIQPSHPRLLEWLADGFRESGFDLKWLMAEIVNSNAYQRSSRFEGVFSPLYEQYFVRHQVKRLTAEQIHDALVVAAGRLPTYNLSRYIRGKSFAMQFPDVVNTPPGKRNRIPAVRQLLQAFMPGDRQEIRRSGRPSPLQALALMNNPFVLGLLEPNREPGTITDVLELQNPILVPRLYLTVLGRQPSPAEQTLALSHLAEGDRAERAADLMWVLFNKTDFYFNY